MLASPRFVDGAFVNTTPVTQGLRKHTAAPTIAEFLCGGQRRTPRAPLPSVVTQGRILNEATENLQEAMALYPMLEIPRNAIS